MVLTALREACPNVESAILLPTEPPPPTWTALADLLDMEANEGTGYPVALNGLCSVPYSWDDDGAMLIMIAKLHGRELRSCLSSSVIVRLHQFPLG